MNRRANIEQVQTQMLITQSFAKQLYNTIAFQLLIQLLEEAVFFQITMELKNQLTKQNVFDAVEQYKNDRTPDEVLFSFKRCIVHFAVDDNEIRMCTELKGKKSWFLPFNKGNRF